MKRVAAVSAVFKKWYGLPLKYGSLDCAHLCNDVAMSFGHKDYLDGIIYHDIDSAKATIKDLGYKNLIQFMDKNFKRIKRGEVMIGDIGLFKSDDAIHALGVNNGADKYIIFGADTTTPSYVRTIEFSENINTAFAYANRFWRLDWQA